MCLLGMQLKKTMVMEMSKDATWWTQYNIALQ